LRACAAAARDAAVELGLRGEDRAGGRPHLTLARASTARGRGQRHIAPLDAWAHALAVYRGPAWQVTEVRVVHSTLGAGRSGGPLHEEVARIRLNSYG
jgi:2'-5' RNA ligase